MPAPATSFVGRERELAELRHLLDSTRLLTLTGAGGIGKSRLALELATALIGAYPDGVCLVDLAPLADCALVPGAVAEALGVSEQPQRSVAVAVAEFLRSRTMLVVLDNCEHLLAGCAALADDLLRASPHLRILATSREALGLAAETRWRVPSLSVPDAPEALVPDRLLIFEAVRLFEDRARAADPGFSVTRDNAQAVAQVCIGLDGIPLAIELAARWARVLTAAEIASRLHDRFRLLVGSRPARSRHRTLRATMDASFELLTPLAQILLRRLGCFAGGATLEAAEAICTGDGLTAPALVDVLAELVDKSLVLFDRDGVHGRYRMLETVRQYAREKLQSAGEETDTSRRHRDWHLHLAEQADAALRGPASREWLDRLELEHDNLRAALAWSCNEEGGADAECRLAGALYSFWWIRGHWSEGARRLEAALSRSDRSAPAALARVLFGVGNLAMLRGDPDRATGELERCLGLARECGEDAIAALVLMRLATNAQRIGETVRATALHDEATAAARNLDDPWLTLLARRHAGLLAWHRGEYDRADVFFRESLAMSRAIGDSYHAGDALRHLGLAALHRSDYTRAAEFFAEGLVLCREIGDRWNLEGCVEGAGQLACARGRHAEAARLFGAAEVLCDTLGFLRAPADRDRHQRCVTATRTWLGDAVFEAAWTEGRRMPLDEAVSCALAEVRSGPERRRQGGRHAAEPHPGLLTAREREVALLIARGMTNREIALHLSLAERTVDAHVRHIFDKVGAHSRAQVAAWVGGQGPRAPTPSKTGT